MTGEADKAGWRARLLAARAELAADELATAAEAVARHVLGRLSGAARIAAYVPTGREPGSLDLLDALRDAGIDILLPVVVAGGLEWASYEGRDRLVAGPRGTRQPSGPRLGQRGLATADAVLVPALAVDHLGTRLGRGGGYYDRALSPLAADPPTAGPLVAALLHDGELVPKLPADPWDRSVTAAVTPRAGWTGLPVVAHHGG